MNRPFSADQNPGLTLLDWSGETFTSQFGRPRSWPVKVPALRIVPPPSKDLFKHAIAAAARSGYWDTVVFAALGISAVGALALAFLGV